MTTVVTRPELPSLSPAQRLVAGALAEVHDTTVADLAVAAGVGKSTVSKTLALLEKSGAALRTIHEDEGGRYADTWSPTVVTGAVLMSTAATDGGYGHADALLDATNAAGDVAMDAGVEAESAAPAGGVDLLAAGADAVAPHAGDTDRGDVAVGDADEKLDAEGTNGSENEDVAAPVAAFAQAAASVEPADSAMPAAVPVVAASSERLAPGGLAELVAAHLIAHPEKDFTPTDLSRHLDGRSSGAIANALVRMCERGTAVQTCDKPRRYRHAEPAAQGPQTT